MKKLHVILLGLFLSAVVAAPALAALEVGGSVYVGYFDKYLWRGFDLSGSLPVVQGGVNLSTEGFTLGYWSNIQTKSDSGEGYEGGNVTETDITVDYTFSPVDKLNVSVGNIWYSLKGADDTKEVYLGLALDVPLAPTVKVYYDYDHSENDSLFYTAAVSHSFDLMDKLSLGVGGLISYNQENYSVGDYSGWHNYELSASLNYAVNDQFSITPSFLYSSPLSSGAKEAIDSEVLGGLTVTMSF